MLDNYIIGIIQVICLIFFIAMISYFLGSLILMIWTDIRTAIRKRKNKRW